MTERRGRFCVVVMMRQQRMVEDLEGALDDGDDASDEGQRTSWTRGRDE